MPTTKHRRPSRLRRIVSPTATSLYDPTVPAPYTVEEIERAVLTLRRLDLAVFMGLSDDDAVAFAKPSRVIHLP